MKKIGEIFEFGGEWYQCVKSSDCPKCDLKHLHNCNHHFHCSTLIRKDGEEVIFKKLEKVGDPFERNGYMYQEYKAHIFPLLMNGDAKIPTRNGFAAIIKQNKEEDMKTVRISKDDLNFLVNKIRYGILPKHTDCDAIIAEITDLFSVEDVILSNSENIGKNLKPFDLEAAKAGKPVCTRDGRKAIFLITLSNKNFPFAAIVSCGQEENIYQYDINGICDEHDENLDLMMVSKKKEGWVNMYKGDNGISKYNCDGIVFNTKEEATQYALNNDSYITTIKISWEE